jgi:hypothetical protein
LHRRRTRRHSRPGRCLHSVAGQEVMRSGLTSACS